MSQERMTAIEKYAALGYTVESDKITDRQGRVWYQRKHTNPVKAIRLFCYECQGTDRRDEIMQPKNAREEIRVCGDPMCPLFDFRFRTNPFRKPMSDERKEALRERLKGKPIGMGWEQTNQEPRQEANP